ncbi:MAG: glutamate racemase [Clostridia bacterium]|nr:glutamate racemase [Clostridia bacterium]
MNNNSIGVFDSGLGGLTAVKSISTVLPKENIVYFGDTGRLPYGTKTEETIKQYAASDIRFLLSHNVKLVVIACGTASSVALSDMRKMFKTPIVGVVEAACGAAVMATNNKKVGVLGTSATIKSSSYLRGIAELDSSIKVFQKACPLFVPLVENGHFDTQVTKLVVEEYLEPIKKEGVDTLILGCTHYPLLEKAISEYMGDGVKIINVCKELAKSIGTILGKDNLAEREDNGVCKYYVSDDEKGFAELGGVFLERKINGQVKKIDIEKY